MVLLYLTFARMWGQAMGDFLRKMPNICPTPLPSVTYLDFLAFLSFLAAFSLFFSGMQPQPQLFFLSAMFITSFLFKHLSKH
jgi:hypothetical protein